MESRARAHWVDAMHVDDNMKPTFRYKITTAIQFVDRIYLSAIR